MKEQRTLLERAYELAASGDCARVSEIARRLASEGYSEPARHLYGPLLKSDLRRVCQAAQQRLRND